MRIIDRETKKEICSYYFIMIAQFNQYDAEATINNLRLIGFLIIASQNEDIILEVDELIGLGSYYDLFVRKGKEYVSYPLLERT